MNVLSDIPVVETERLILRGWRQDDIDAMAALFADEAGTRFTGGTEDRAGAWRQMAAYAGHWVLKGWGPFAVTLKDGGETIGYCGPWDPEGKADEPEITYGLATTYHGKGYGTEAVRAALHFAQETLGWRTAVSFIDTDNHASLAVARKLGARRDGETLLYGSVPVEIWRYPDAEASNAETAA